VQSLVRPPANLIIRLDNCFPEPRHKGSTLSFMRSVSNAGNQPPRAQRGIAGASRMKATLARGRLHWLVRVRPRLADSTPADHPARNYSTCGTPPPRCREARRRNLRPQPLPLNRTSRAPCETHKSCTPLTFSASSRTPELTGAHEPPKPSKFSMRDTLITRPVE